MTSALNLLRQAGHSLRERRGKWLDDFTPYFLVVFAFLMVWVVEWTQRITGNHTTPGFWILMAILVTAYGGCRVYRLFPPLRRTHGGESGAGVVAAILSRIRRKEIVVRHDVCIEDKNISHVVVSPSGIFALTTKFRTGKGFIDYFDANELVFGGRIRDALPLRQAHEAAEALRLELGREFNTEVPVKALLVVAGEWIVRQAPGDFEVDVVAADHLETYFERQQPELTHHEISEVGSRLKNFRAGG